MKFEKRYFPIVSVVATDRDTLEQYVTIDTYGHGHKTIQAAWDQGVSLHHTHEKKDDAIIYRSFRERVAEEWVKI